MHVECLNCDWYGYDIDAPGCTCPECGCETAPDRIEGLEPTPDTAADLILTAWLYGS